MARCSWALIDSMAVVVVQLGVDVPTAAAALESSSAAWRRRLRCLCSLGRAHASGGAARQPSGGARHLRTRHIGEPRNACNLQHFRLLQKIADFDGLCKRDSVRTDQD